METAFLENVVAAVAGELDVPAVDRPDLLGAELAVDEDGVGGEAEGTQRVHAGQHHGGASTHDDLEQPFWLARLSRRLFVHLFLSLRVLVSFVCLWAS